MNVTKDSFKDALGCLMLGANHAGLSVERMMEVLDDVLVDYYAEMENSGGYIIDPNNVDDLTSGLTVEEESEIVNEGIDDGIPNNNEVSINEIPIQESNKDEEHQDAESLATGC